MCEVHLANERKFYLLRFLYFTDGLSFSRGLFSQMSTVDDIMHSLRTTVIRGVATIEATEATASVKVSPLA